MKQNRHTASDQDILLEDLVAELTCAAYAVALWHGREQLWLDLELHLWRVLTETVQKWGGVNLSDRRWHAATSPTMDDISFQDRRSACDQVGPTEFARAKDQDAARQAVLGDKPRSVGERTMTPDAHLWAISYDDMARAEQVRDQITRLAWGSGPAAKPLILYDIAVVVRHPDGSFSFDREPFPGTTNILACTAVGFLAGLALAVPLTGATIGALVGGAGTAAMAAEARITNDFVRQVERLIQPGTSALFILDDVGVMEAALQQIQGLGGTVLKTNVDLERARLIQSTLAQPQKQPAPVQHP